MPLEREMLTDRSEAREKFLRAFRVAKAAHATFAFACWLMAVLCAIVQSRCSFDEHVLHVRKFRDLGFCRRIAAQLIGDDLAGQRARTQHTLEEAFSSRFVAPLLKQDVEFGAMLVHRTPQQVRFASQRDEHLVEMPRTTRLATHRFHTVSKVLTEFVAPASGCLVCHDHAALEEQFLDVAQAQLEAEIPSNSPADDTSRETVPVIKRFRFFHRAILRDRPNNLTMPFPWLKERHGAGEPFEGPAWMIAKEAARRLHVRLVTVRVGFDDKLRILDESRADATIAPLIATAERTRQYGVVVYSQASQCLFGRANNPKLSGARSLDDLNRPDVTIAVVKDAPQGSWLRTRLPSTKVIEIPGNITTVPTAEIVAGRADVATIDQYFFAATSRRIPALASLPFGTSCLDSHELPLPIGLAVPKDRADLQVLFTHIVADRRACLASEQHRVVTAGP